MRLYNKAHNNFEQVLLVIDTEWKRPIRRSTNGKCPLYYDLLSLCLYQGCTLCLKKNTPDVFSYNSRKHWRIFI